MRLFAIGDIHGCVTAQRNAEAHNSFQVTGFCQFPTLDSNQDQVIQSHSCYRYTSGECCAKGITYDAACRASRGKGTARKLLHGGRGDHERILTDR